MLVIRWNNSFKLIISCLAFFLLGHLTGLESEFNMTSLNMYETTTNRNFKIYLNEHSVFLRIGRDNPMQVGIDRSAEIENYKIAEKLGLSPKLLAYQVDNGILVTEFVEGQAPSELRVHELEFLEKITQNLKLLHNCQSDYQNRLKTNVFIKNNRLLKEFFTINEDIIESEKIGQWVAVKSIFENGYYEGIPDGVCHGDLFRGNILETPDGTVFLLDWEYSYYGPVIDDLGKLCSANWLTDEEIRFIAKTYWNTISSTMIQKIKQNIYMQQINLYLWCKIQASSNPNASLNYLSLAGQVEEHLNQIRGRACDSAIVIDK